MKSKNCRFHTAHRASDYLTRRDFLKMLGVGAAGLALAGCQSALDKASEQAVQLPGIESGEQVPGIAGKKPVVGIVRAEGYGRNQVRQHVEALLDSIGGLGDVLAHGNRVAIKTNLTGGTSVAPLPGIPEIESYLTHPEIVRALVELLRDSGVKDIFIVEAVYENDSWPVYGYSEMAKDVGAQLIDLNYADPFPDFVKASTGPSPFIYDELTFNPILEEIDAFISVSKMKCHNNAGVTHTMKNLVGLVPYRFYTLNPGDRYRSGMHGPSSETRKRLPRVIVDLNVARPIHLGLIDGIMTSEAGEGPWIPAMTQIKPGIMFAGKDVVATDAVATAAMGFDPVAEYPDEPFVHGDNHLNIAASLGLGTNNLADIEIIGENLADVTMQFTPSY
jgi:uncharacterized protein (DUF362 family)